MPLIISASNRFDKCLDSLIKAKVNLNARDKDGQTPPVKPTVKGYDKSICKLINAEADIILLIILVKQHLVHMQEIDAFLV